MLFFYILLYVLAIACFLVETSRVSTRVNMLALGFVFVTLVPLLQLLRSL